MSEAFLSYNSQDRSAAAELHERLRAGGIGVFQDVVALRAGDRWLERIEEALSRCSAFIVLVGRGGISRWVGGETQLALARHFSASGDEPRLPIVPVILGEGNPGALTGLVSLFQAVRWSPGEDLPDDLHQALRSSRMDVDGHPELHATCPYLGLAAFRSEHSHLFFGRTRETLEALRCLGDTLQTDPERLAHAAGASFTRWLQVEGNSGSGKSSLVQAGMLPMIERGALWPSTGLAHWRLLHPMTPGRDPLTNLAEAIEIGLEPDERRRDVGALAARLRGAGDDALAVALRNFKRPDTGFVLVVDQFEELFTLAEPAHRDRFDVVLARALQESECPLFVISTVRADFLDRIEQLPRLSTLYNLHCRRYLLPPITAQGLREAIEFPGRLAGLDVSDVATAIVADARDESGALPLAENALRILWNEREGDRLSGQVFESRGKLAGMLSNGADHLLDAVEAAAPGRGRRAALELLLALTHVNPDGRHTRQRLTREAAVLSAGNGDAALGERVLGMLSGERHPGLPAASAAEVLRLVNTGTDETGPWVDLIHETLIRARGHRVEGPLLPYWPTLYRYVEDNRDRDILRQQLELKITRWRHSARLLKPFRLAGAGELLACRRLRFVRGSPERRFLAISARMVACEGIAALLLLIAALALAESAWWVSSNQLPLEYMFIQPLWYLGWAPVPHMVPIKAGRFTMGCVPGRDADRGAPCEPAPVAVEIRRGYEIGETPVTFLQYDYYVWRTGGKGSAAARYPLDEGFGRRDNPVIHVSWYDAVEYATWLGGITHRDVRLPSPTEWEYAARAGIDKRYPWGDDTPVGRANCGACMTAKSNRGTEEVGRHAANLFGVKDMAGNVWQWLDDGARVDGDSRRPIRGGSWNYPFDSLRIVSENKAGANHSNKFLGFRVVAGGERVRTPSAAASPSASSAVPSQDVLPVSMTECEATRPCERWNFTGTRGDAHPGGGESSALYVEHADARHLAIRRTILQGLTTGTTSEYEGDRQGERIEGVVTSGPTGRKPHATGRWTATLDVLPTPLPGRMRACSTPDYEWCWEMAWKEDGLFTAVSNHGQAATVDIPRFSNPSVVLRWKLDHGYRAINRGAMVPRGDVVDDGSSLDSNGTKGHFIATWGDALKDLPAIDAAPPPRQGPVACFRWFDGIKCR